LVAHRYWDACVFLGFLKEEPDKIAQCEAGIRQAEEGKLMIVTSALSLAEVLYLVKGELPVTTETRDKVRGFFSNDYIVLCEMDRTVGERAQDVVWDHDVRHKDAIHVATALTMLERLAIERLDTFDGPLSSLSGKIEGLDIGEPNFPGDLLSDAAAHGTFDGGSLQPGASLGEEASP
jgi:predicted nucleic acid-binding protein